MKLFTLQPRLVTQTDLEIILTLGSQMARLKERRDRLSVAALERLAAGAEVEPGLRDCQIEEIRRGGCRLQRLIVR